jgi:hypothetical protein
MKLHQPDVVLVVVPGSPGAKQLKGYYQAVEHYCTLPGQSRAVFNVRVILRLILNANRELFTLTEVKFAVGEYVTMLAATSQPPIEGAQLEQVKRDADNDTIVAWTKVCDLLKSAA